MKVEIDITVVTAGGINTLLIMYTICRQKISKGTEDFNNNGERGNDFPLKMKQKTAQLLPLLLSIVLEVLARAMR